MKHLFVFGFVQLAACCLMTAAGSNPGSLAVKTPEGDPVIVRANARRAGTVLVYLTARDSKLDPVARQISALNQKYRHRGFLFVGIFPERETATEIRSFSQANGLNFPVYLGISGKSAAALDIAVEPAAFVLDKNWNLTYRGPISGLARALEVFGSGAPAIDLPLDGSPLN